MKWTLWEVFLEDISLYTNKSEKAYHMTNHALGLARLSSVQNIVYCEVAVGSLVAENTTDEKPQWRKLRPEILLRDELLL